ncbi:tRNA lysidine(34) synthetase TilS [Rothia kristinae]|uniref:tRNA lysidine(34) synthetase TilS n=1 Tax=Rothia kristinae TaxID=37923 RepID=UPI002E2C32E5|nr:tRNA lysidine(34) synthetase TilS [Rothia kristinae]MED6046752.1 tRNA lysidine(34) synthetase TilS [Rothia kristinae]
MAQSGRTGRLHPAVGAARRRLARHLAEHAGLETTPTGRAARSAEAGRRAGRGEQDPASSPGTPSAPAHRAAQGPLLLVACSGGPDSLALAALTAHFARRGDLRAGAIVVDHGLQEGSAQVARRAAEQCRELSLAPVLIRRAAVEPGGHGPEMAARIARYRAFEEAVAELGEQGETVAGILLGHTRDDQAETVMLGLARGSGTRSLAGMPPARPLAGLGIDGEPITAPKSEPLTASIATPPDEPPRADPDGTDETPSAALLLRPLLGTTREEVEQILAAEGLSPWRDPSNADTSLRRNLVRHDVLPHLERTLDPGIAQALARTAEVLTEDADLLDALAARRAQDARADPGRFHPVPEQALAALSLGVLSDTHPALRRRILAAALQEAGGAAPTHERLAALEELLGGRGNAGPVQMPGRVTVWRRRALERRAPEPEAAGALILTRTPAG